MSKGGLSNVTTDGAKPMTCYVYRPIERVFLADDEKDWTPDFFSAAGFKTRDLADAIAVRELGEGHDAYVLDDGIEE